MLGGFCTQVTSTGARSPLLDQLHVLSLAHLIVCSLHVRFFDCFVRSVLCTFTPPFARAVHCNRPFVDTINGSSRWLFVCSILVSFVTRTDLLDLVTIGCSVPDVSCELHGTCRDCPTARHLNRSKVSGLDLVHIPRTLAGNVLLNPGCAIQASRKLFLVKMLYWKPCP
jgi:hypothetical protein